MAAVHPSPVSTSGYISNPRIGFLCNGIIKSSRSRKILSLSFESPKSSQIGMETEWLSTNMNFEKLRWKRSDCNRVTLKVSATAESLADAKISNGAADFEIEEKVADGLELKEEKAREREKFDWNSHWYPVSVVEELDKKVPHAVTILGRDLVVWWDRNGKSWQVFDDKCPHRMAPLSEGRINEQGELQCCYHGWSFAPCSGDCTCIPQAAADDNPVWKSKRACAAVYPSVEQEGMIWFWPDTRPEFKDIAASNPPPSIPSLRDPSFKDQLSIRDLPYSYEQLIENLMDPAHVPFAHHGLQSHRKNAKPLKFKVEKIEQSGYIGKAERGPAVFTAPCIFTMNSQFNSPPAKNGAEAETMVKEFILLFICIPVSPGQSKLIWAFRRNFTMWIDYVLPRWFIHIRQMLVLDSDLYLLHLTDRKVAEVGNENWEKACYVPTTADAFVIAFRKWLRVYAGGAPDWGGKYSGQLPPTPPKEQLMDRYWSHVRLCRHCKAALQFFEGAEILMQALSVGSAAVLGAAALKPIPQLRSWSIPLVCIAVVCSLASRGLSHFIKKTYHFHDYNHALVK